MWYQVPEFEISHLRPDICQPSLTDVSKTLVIRSANDSFSFLEFFFFLSFFFKPLHNLTKMKFFATFMLDKKFLNPNLKLQIPKILNDGRNLKDNKISSNFSVIRLLLEFFFLLLAYWIRRFQFWESSFKFGSCNVLENFKSTNFH